MLVDSVWVDHSFASTVQRQVRMPLVPVTALARFWLCIPSTAQSLPEPIKTCGTRQVDFSMASPSEGRGNISHAEQAGSGRECSDRRDRKHAPL